jgi:putative oxidoreductase
MSIAFLIIRLIVGLGIAAHGTQKLFGWFGGYGVDGTGGFFESLGFRPGTFFALAAGLGETAGGLLLFLGLGGPVGPAIVVLVMLVAIFSVHITKGFFTQFGGWEMPALYIAGALAVAFAGPGAYSLDRAFGITVLSQENQIWYALAAAVVLAGLNLLARRPVKTAAPQE